MDMFGFMDMADNYDDRKFERYEVEGLTISTASVSDSEFIETAVSHLDYKDGGWIVVENSKTEEEARQAHARWIETMTTEPLPEELREVSQATVLQMGDAILGKEFREEMIYKRNDSVKGDDSEQDRT